MAVTKTTAARRTAVVAASVLVAAVCSTSAADTCPGVSPLMSNAVVPVSPACFQSCPALCDIIDSMMTKYIAAPDEDKDAVAAELQGQVCEKKKEFACIFGDNLAVCQPVITMGKTVVTSIPGSLHELESQCKTGAVEASPVNGVHDIIGETTTTAPEESATDSATATSSVSSAVAAAAVAAVAFAF